MSGSGAYPKKMTRKTTSQELELKLKRALEEIKELREDNSQILKERDENEEESLKIINNNTQLKGELADLHAQFLDVLSQRDQLIDTVTNFDQCSETYEQALQRIQDLEVELRDANKLIQQYEEDKRCQEVLHTHSLYEELIGSPAGQEASLNHSSCLRNDRVRRSKKNSFKKYVKINNFIKKTEKLIKRQKCHQKNVLLRKQRVDLLDSLELYSKKLDESRSKYEVDTQELQADISRLHRSLERMTDKYNSAQGQISEHILAASRFIEQCNCHLSTGGVDEHQVMDEPQLLEGAENDLSSVQHTINNSDNNLIMFSDKIGVGFGPLLNEKINHNVTNYCMPNTSFNQIIARMNTCSFSKQSIITLMIGNALDINKRDLIQGFSTLSDLNVNKIILCAFPFSRYYTPSQNNSIHLLNTLLYNLTYNHSDKFVFFDTNKFIDNKFLLTGKTFYLPNKNKRELATLLAYNINNMFIQTLEVLPKNNLN